MARLTEFEYAYTHGPLDTREALARGFATGNCRRALQDFMHVRHGRFFLPEQIYIPESYDAHGIFVHQEGEEVAPAKLQEGDVIYAQKRRSKSGRPVEAGPEQYDSRDEWLFSLHNAVYVGAVEEDMKQLLPADATVLPGVHYVWHATIVANGTALWDWDRFTHYYAPVSAKRFL